MNEELDRARKTRDYSALRLWTVSWEDFRGIDFAQRISNLHGFTFNAKLSGLGRWSEIVNSNRVALQLNAAIEESLNEAEFFNIPDLETIIENERISFRYEDPDFGFDLYFQGDGSIHLRRPGSSLENFHHWYTRFMPAMPGILNRAIASIDGELQRSLRGDDPPVGHSLRAADDANERVRVLAAGFTFNVVCYRLRYSGQVAKNLDVMRKNLAVRMPDARGRFTRDSVATDFENYGRMDYRVSIRHETEPCIHQFMSVEAPSNSGWSGLFFALSYSGSNFTDADGARQSLDPELFLSSARCADAYISFFRDIGLTGFLASVMSGFEFETATASLA